MPQNSLVPVTPFTSYQQGVQGAQQTQSNQLAMQGQRQAQGINQQKMQMQQQEQQMKGVASLGKYLDTITDPAKKEQAFQAAIQKMPAMGMRTPPPGSSYESMKGKIEQAKIQVYGEGDAPTKRTMPAGANNRGQNLVVDRLYQGTRVIEESKPYIKKEIERTGAVDVADYETKSTRDKAKLAGQDAEISVRNNIEGIGEVKNLVASPDFQGGLSGDIYSMANSVVQQYHQATGSKSLIDANGVLDESKLKLSKQSLSRFRRAAINDDRTESATLELAFILAKDLNEDGKISDADVRQAEKILGKGGDKDALLSTLSDVQKRMIRKYNNKAKVKGWNQMKMEDITGKKGVDFDINADPASHNMEQKKAQLKALQQQLNQ